MYALPEIKLTHLYIPTLPLLSWTISCFKMSALGYNLTGVTFPP
jgi:hypothetical protein